MYNHTQPAVWCGTFDGGVAFVALHCSCYSAAFKVQFFFSFHKLNLPFLKLSAGTTADMKTSVVFILMWPPEGDKQD